MKYGCLHLFILLLETLQKQAARQRIDFRKQIENAGASYLYERIRADNKNGGRTMKKATGTIAGAVIGTMACSMLGAHGTLIVGSVLTIANYSAKACGAITQEVAKASSNFKEYFCG